MAVTSVVALAFGSSASGQQSIGGTGNEAAPSVRYRAKFRARCDSPSDDPSIVYKHLEQNKGTLPWYGNKYQLGNGLDATALVNRLDIEVVDGSDRAFDIDVGYEPLNLSSDIQPIEPPDPLDWLDDIEVSFTQILVPVERGVFHGFSSTLKPEIVNAKMAKGETLAITNSACVPYDPPIEEEEEIKVIRISKSVKVYDGSLFDDWQGAINKDQFVINKGFYGYRETFKPLTAKIRYIGGVFSRTGPNGVKYWRQTIEIHKKLTGWRRKLLDRGILVRREQGDPDGEGSTVSASNLVPAGKANFKVNKDAAGYPMTEPVLFDGNGQPQRVTYPPVYGEWGTKPEVSFAPLAGRAW